MHRQEMASCEDGSGQWRARTLERRGTSQPGFLLATGSLTSWDTGVLCATSLLLFPDPFLSSVNLDLPATPQSGFGGGDVFRSSPPPDTPGPRLLSDQRFSKCGRSL